MINATVVGLLVAAFVAGAFVASPELRAYAANTVGSADIINNSIQSVDIKDGEVKTNDIASGAVTGLKIRDGTIRDADVSVTFMPIRTTQVVAPDGECAAPDPPFPTTQFSADFFGWCPDGENGALHIVEVEGITEDSTIIATFTVNTGGDRLQTQSCHVLTWIDVDGTGRNVVNLATCNDSVQPPAEGSDLRLVIFNPR